MRIIRKTVKPAPFKFTYKAYVATAVVSWFVGIYSFQPFIEDYFRQKPEDGKTCNAAVTPDAQ